MVLSSEDNIISYLSITHFRDSTHSMGFTKYANNLDHKSREIVCGCLLGISELETKTLSESKKAFISETVSIDIPSFETAGHTALTSKNISNREMGMRGAGMYYKEQTGK